MKDRKKVLFVCTANQQRSRTAEDMYRGDARFEVRSAGTSDLADHTIDEDDIRWADLIVVMEREHERNIRRRFPDLLNARRIAVLDIPDIYYRGDTTLQREIRQRFESEIGR